jgi:hypothetical protein
VKIIIGALLLLFLRISKYSKLQMNDAIKKVVISINNFFVVILLKPSLKSLNLKRKIYINDENNNTRL